MQSNALPLANNPQLPKAMEKDAMQSHNTMQKSDNRNNTNQKSRNAKTRQCYRPVAQATKQTSSIASTQANSGKTQSTLKRDRHKPKAKDTELCIVCANALHYHAIGECNHAGICSKCYMRMRFVMKDQSCPMCKKSLAQVIVSDSKRSYESFQRWGEDIIEPNSILDPNSNMIFVGCQDHYNELCRLRELSCRVPSCPFSQQSFATLNELLRHLKTDHDLIMCSLCMEHQHFFIQEYPVYTRKKLAAHNSADQNGSGQKKSGKERHPLCQFCRKRYYSDMELFQHLEKDHFKCHLCPSEQQYYRNYSSLEMHFRGYHFLCEERRCLEARFVVFGNDLEYQAHMAQAHRVRHPRVALNFQVASASHSHTQRDADATSGPDTWIIAESERQNVERVNDLDQAFPALPRPASLTTSDTRPSSHPTVMRNRSSASSGTLASETRQGQIARNRRLAQALGIARPGFDGESDQAFVLELVTPAYSEPLIEWGKLNIGYLSTVERRLERLVKDPKCFHVSLKPMAREERACMHELAANYGVSSQSFHEEPRRRIMFFAKDDAKVPAVLLSKSIAQQRRSLQIPSSAAPVLEPRPGSARNGSCNRGWERIEPVSTPELGKDAWSDDTSEEAHSPSEV